MACSLSVLLMVLVIGSIACDDVEKDLLLTVQDQFDVLFSDDDSPADLIWDNNHGIDGSLVPMETIILQGRELLRDCSGTQCHICIHAVLTVCVTAKYLKQNIGFSVDMTINGKLVFHKEISVANPPAICANHVPGLDKLMNICLQLYDVNIKEKSACARIVFVLKIGFLKKKFQLKIGCFRIPFENTRDDEMMFDWSTLTAN